MPVPTSQSQRTAAHSWIRNNVLGLVAIFIALNGTAIGAQVALDEVKKQGAKKAAKKKTKAVRGPAGPQGPTGPQGPAGSVSGTAGGELAGTYPNPTVGVVAGLDLAPDNTAAGGINFGTDGGKLYTNGFGQVRAGVNFAVDGSTSLGSLTTDTTRVHGATELLDASTAGDALKFCDEPTAGCLGASTNANLYSSAENVLHTDDGFDAAGGLTSSGSLTIDANATLGNAATDTLTVNAGPINLPNAITAADGIEFGTGLTGPANLYRPTNNALATDDRFEAPTLEVQSGEIRDHLDFSTDNDVELILAGRMGLKMTCLGGVSTLVAIWPDGETDTLATDAGSSC